MGHRAEWSGEVAVRGWDGRDEARRLREHPGIQEASCRLDDAGRADRVAGRAVRGGHLRERRGLTVRAAAAAGDHWVVAEKKGRKGRVIRRRARPVRWAVE